MNSFLAFALIALALWALHARVRGLEKQIAALRPGAARQSAPKPSEPVAAAEAQATVAAAPPMKPPPEPIAAFAPPVESALWRAIRSYFVGGNTVVRVGIIVLFFGVAFLLKYAADHARFPIELRLMGVAAGAIVLFGVGWWQRDRQRQFSLALQGGAVGLLYLTVFAAFRLYHLVPSALAFALLGAIGVASALLAVRQNSPALAILGMSGGYVAPVLASSGAGSHVVLFSYYAVLCAGVLLIAWFKPWRYLNLLSFAFTFGIGTAWGVTRYEPANFPTTEPFLVFYFLTFVAIAVLFAWRRGLGRDDYIDRTLVFATPVVAMGLQSALIGNVPFGRAYSALAAAAIYLGLAFVLLRQRREQLQLLVESFLALGVAFLTLAVPLALGAQWTAATWALEGAAVLWVGQRQQRLVPCVSGILLQLAAGIALSSHAPYAFDPAQWVDHSALGGVLIAVGALICVRLLLRPSPLGDDNGSVVSTLLMVWGIGWWLFAAH